MVVTNGDIANIRARALQDRPIGSDEVLALLDIIEGQRRQREYLEGELLFTKLGRRTNEHTPDQDKILVAEVAAKALAT